MKEFRQSQTSARQEELRSELVFVALSHEPARRSNEHMATVARYLCGSQDVVFATGMPPELLRRICAGAETALVEDGEALFKAGEPATTLHIVLSGQVKLSRTVSRETRQVGTLGIGRAPDYDDFVSTHGVRRTSCHADGTAMMLKLDKQIYEQAIAEHADVEIAERLAAVASSEIFSGIPHKLRLQVAEMLRPARFRHGTRVAVRGTAADRLWFLRSGSCKVITTLKRPAQVRDVKIQGWGTKSTVKEVDVIQLQAGDVLGEESIANTKFRPTPTTHAHHAMAIAMDTIGATHFAGGGGDHTPGGGGGGGEDEGAGAAAPTASGTTPGGTTGGSSAEQAAEVDAEKRYRVIAVKYSHTVVADGEVTAYELPVGDLWKVMRAASDGMREAFAVKHRAALARRESLHSAQVAEICAVQPVMWPDHKPRPASASSLLVRSNAGVGRGGGPGQGGTAVKPRPATAGPSRGGTVGLGARIPKAPAGQLAGTVVVQKRQPATETGATASSHQESQRMHQRQRPASAAPRMGGTGETDQGHRSTSMTISTDVGTGAVPKQTPKLSRPSTARASFMRGTNWDHALGGSNRDPAGSEGHSAGNAGTSTTANDSRTLEEFMRPIPVDKKKKKKVLNNQKSLSIAQQEVLARRAAARNAGYQKQKNPLLGRRKEWPYVETLKSRREETKSSGVQGGAKAARDALQNVAFWPHCRFDKKAFILDMPSGSNTAEN
eukprot:COSAG02_NODE_4406_length_5396_cov_1.985463_3_plen_723_part_00